jgi:hypothetical protein
MTPNGRVLTAVVCGAGLAAATGTLIKRARDRSWTVQVVASLPVRSAMACSSKNSSAAGLDWSERAEFHLDDARYGRFSGYVRAVMPKANLREPSWMEIYGW